MLRRHFLLVFPLFRPHFNLVSNKQLSISPYWSVKSAWKHTIWQSLFPSSPIILGPFFDSLLQCRENKRACSSQHQRSQNKMIGRQSVVDDWWHINTRGTVSPFLEKEERITGIFFRNPIFKFCGWCCVQTQFDRTVLEEMTHLVLYNTSTNSCLRPRNYHLSTGYFVIFRTIVQYCSKNKLSRQKFKSRVSPDDGHTRKQEMEMTHTQPLGKQNKAIWILSMRLLSIRTERW